MSEPRVTVIVPNWNGKDLIGDTLKSLKRQSLKDFATLVVDNGSTDGSADYLEQHYPDVTTIRLSRNLGFAGGVNEGILQAKTPYIALLNNDAIADQDWLKNLVAALDNHPRVAIAASMMLQKSHPDRIDSAGEEYSKWGLPFPAGRGEITKTYHPKKSICAASGGASIYRSEVLEQIGLFDESFFAYYEDVDISLRARMAGYDISLVPEAIVYHAISATTKELGHFGRYQVIKNSNLLFYKNLPAPLLFRLLPGFILVQLVLLLGAIRHGAALEAARAYVMVALNIPSLCRKRRKIQTQRKITINQLSVCMTTKWPLARGGI
jgi:GT2 family glycosyltransferase